MFKKKLEKKNISFREIMTLIGTRLFTRVKWSIEYVIEVYLYYSSWRYAKADMALILPYFFHNPYRISARFLSRRGDKEIHTFGETPLRTVEQIARTACITQQDVVYELGAGRYRMSLWLAHYIGCRVIGLEIVPFFVECAHKALREYPHLFIKQKDFFEESFENATVIYLNGTCLCDEQIIFLVKQFKKLNHKVRFITVSFALNEYDSQQSFSVLSHFEASLSWGKAEIFIQQRLPVH